MSVFETCDRGCLRFVLNATKSNCERLQLSLDFRCEPKAVNSICSTGRPGRMSPLARLLPMMSVRTTRKFSSALTNPLLLILDSFYEPANISNIAYNLSYFMLGVRRVVLSGGGIT